MHWWRRIIALCLALRSYRWARCARTAGHRGDPAERQGGRRDPERGTDDCREVAQSDASGGDGDAMLFVKGNLRAALILAREEGMCDGQDPTVVMNTCSEVQLDATVQLEIEVCAKGSTALRIVLDKGNATRVIAPTLDWP